MNRSLFSQFYIVRPESFVILNQSIARTSEMLSQLRLRAGLCESTYLVGNVSLRSLANFASS